MVFLREKYLWPNWDEKPQPTPVGFSQHFTIRANHVTIVTTPLQSNTHVTVYPQHKLYHVQSLLRLGYTLISLMKDENEMDTLLLVLLNKRM